MIASRPSTASRASNSAKPTKSRPSTTPASQPKSESAAIHTRTPQSVMKKSKQAKQSDGAADDSEMSHAANGTVAEPQPQQSAAKASSNSSNDATVEAPKSKNKKRRADRVASEDDNAATATVTAAAATNEIEPEPSKGKKRKVADASAAVEPTSDAAPIATDPSTSIEAVLEGEPEINYEFTKLDWSRMTNTTTTAGDDSQSDEKTLKAITAMGFTRMTEIQARAIPALMAGVDLMGQAKTGSGKTLAFLIPAIHLLWNLGFKQRNGTGVLVIAPTRELALQIYGVARELCQFHSFTVGCVMGGANRKSEVDKLSKGCTILIGTPGRLLDHLNNTPQFLISHLKCLIIDEADRILEIGFEQEVKDILTKLPNNANRQTMLFSATQSSSNIRDLIKLSLKRNPLFINVSENASVATVSNLEQGYVICPSQQRFLLLFTFLKKNLNKQKKIIVFFSTCAATQFYSELLNYIDIPVHELHGQLKQNKRTATFFEFCNCASGILLATDVAARGLDIPAVDWIIQFDPPEDPKEYIHRVGRTARGVNTTKTGRALLFLLPSELLFLKYLKQAKIPLNEYEFPLTKLATVQNQLEELISKNYYLHKSAREAYRSYIQAYAQHSLKQVFNVHELDILEVARSFGFQTPPKVQLKIGIKQKKPQGKHGFSEDQPYGAEAKPAKQWSR